MVSRETQIGTASGTDAGHSVSRGIARASG
jgi:hypothetical protein